MTDPDDQARRRAALDLADTRTGHPPSADAAADPIHGVAPRTGAPGADVPADGTLGRPDAEAARMRAPADAPGPDLGPAGARARLLTTALPFGWKGLLGFGVLTALGGAAAILMPFAGTLATAGFAAAMFVLLGAGTLYMAVRGDERVVPHRAMNGALGALMIVFGVLALFNPLGAILSLTILAASFFVAEGAMRLWLAFRSREREGWGWLALGGAFSVALGLMLFLGLPGTAIWALGLILGIDLLATGIAMIALSFAEKRATGDVDEASPA